MRIPPNKKQRRNPGLRQTQGKSGRIVSRAVSVPGRLQPPHGITHGYLTIADDTRIDSAKPVRPTVFQIHEQTGVSAISLNKAITPVVGHFRDHELRRSNRKPAP